MGDLYLENQDVFNDGSDPVGPKVVELTWTEGDWMPPLPFDANIVFYYLLSGTAPDSLKARVSLSNDAGTTVVGVMEQTNSTAGGEEEIEDSTKNLKGIDTTDYHIFSVAVYAGFSWRLDLIRTVGDATTSALVKANIIGI